MKLLQSDTEWRSLVDALPLEKREEKTVVETVTETEHVSTIIYRTIISTISYPPVTIHHTDTMTTTLEARQPTTTETSSLARVAPVLRQNGPAATTAIPEPVPANPTAKTDADNTHHLSATVILGIVLGTLAFIGLAVAGFLFARRMLRKYRQQRIWRKQITSEGNPMPNLRLQQDGTMQMPDGFNLQHTAGGSLNQFLSANYCQPYDTTYSEASRTGGEAFWNLPNCTQRTAGEREEQAEAGREKKAEAEDYPPEYTIDLNEK